MTLLALTTLTLATASDGESQHPAHPMPSFQEPCTLHFISTQWCNSAGVFRMAMNQYSGDPDWAIELMLAFVQNRKVAQAILEGIFPNRIGKDDVEIDFRPDQLQFALETGSLILRPPWLYAYRNVLLHVKNGSLYAVDEEGYEQKNTSARLVREMERYEGFALQAFEELTKKKSHFEELLPNVKKLVKILQDKRFALSAREDIWKPEFELLQKVISGEAQ